MLSLRYLFGGQRDARSAFKRRHLVIEKRLRARRHWLMAIRTKSGAVQEDHDAIPDRREHLALSHR